MDGLLAVAGWELRAAARSRWVVAASIAFAGSVAAVEFVGMRGARELGLAGGGPTAASLIGVSLFLPSLIGFLLGSGSLASGRERGDLTLALAQPLSRASLIAGTFCGLASTVSTVALLGFAGGLVIVSGSIRSSDLTSIVALAAISIGLAAASIALGILVSAVTRGRSQATASAIAIWFMLAAGLDLALATIVPSLGLGGPGMLAMILVNPFECARILALLAAGSPETMLGTFGSYLSVSFGNGTTVAVLGFALLGWIVAPLAAATAVVARRDA